MRREDFPVELMKYVVNEWEEGDYRLGYFLCVLENIGSLLFDSEMMVQGLKFAEKKLNLENGTLVKDWKYIISI